MTDEEINIAIAEVCGWQVGAGPEGRQWFVRDGQWRKTPPNYTADLNAMAEASQYASDNLMDADQWEQYGEELEDAHPTAVLNQIGDADPIDYYDLASIIAGLTARQRAEAFLRTLGKWKEGE